MFLLSKTESIINQNITDLIQPSYLESDGRDAIFKYFGITEEKGEREAKDIDHIMVVRENGDTCEIKVTVLTMKNGVYTAKLHDASSDAASDMSSDTEGYQRTVSSIGSSYASTFYPTSIRGSFFGGLEVDMNEIDTDNEWVGVGHYSAGMEESYQDGGKATVSAISLTISFVAAWRELNVKLITRCLQA